MLPLDNTLIDQYGIDWNLLSLKVIAELLLAQGHILSWRSIVAHSKGIFKQTDTWVLFMYASAVFFVV